MRQAVHPAWNLLPTENLGQRAGKVVTVVVHQMVPITAELVPQLLDDPADLLLGEVCAADLYTLSKPKLIAKLVVVTWRDFKHSGEGEGMATVGKLRPEHLDSRVEYTQSDRGGVLVDPVHVVHVQDDRLAASHRGRQQLVASAVLWHPEAAGEGQIAGKPVREHHNSIQPEPTESVAVSKGSEGSFVFFWFVWVVLKTDLNFSTIFQAMNKPCTKR